MRTVNFFLFPSLPVKKRNFQRIRDANNPSFVADGIHADSSSFFVHANVYGSNLLIYKVTSKMKLDIFFSFVADI